jgi:hypothetical protein
MLDNARYVNSADFNLGAAWPPTGAPLALSFFDPYVVIDWSRPT